MDKVRISEIAQELGAKSKEVIEKAQEIGISVKAQSSTVTYKEAESLMNYFLTGVNDRAVKKEEKPKEIEQSPKVATKEKQQPHKEPEQKEEKMIS